MPDGFDRIKPPTRRLLERPSVPGDAEADPAGRAALFSAGQRREGRPTQEELGLASHCSRCGQTVELDPSTIIRSALPLFLLAPWKDHPVFAVCPACRTRSWLRIQGGSGSSSDSGSRLG